MNNTPPLNIYRKIAGFFILITVILVVIILYYSISYAYIKVKPMVTEKDVSFNFLVTENENAFDVEKGIFKGILVDQTLEAEGDFETTGTKTFVKNGIARVVIINNNNKEQPLVKTTRLLTTDKILYRISDTISIPTASRTEVNIYQDDPNVASSIKVGDKFIIPGLRENLQQLIYAELITDPSGEESEVSVLSQEDIDKAIDNLITKLKDQLSLGLQENEITVLKAEILTQDISVPVSSISSTFHLKIKVNLKGVIVKNDEVKSFAQNVFENNLQDDQTSAGSNELPITLTLDSIDEASDVAQVGGLISGSFLLRKNSDILNKEKLYKLTASEVVAYLNNSDLVDDVSVTFFPFWVHKIPSFSDHVIIEFD